MEKLGVTLLHFSLLLTITGTGAERFCDADEGKCSGYVLGDTPY